MAHTHTYTHSTINVWNWVLIKSKCTVQCIPHIHLIIRLLDINILFNSNVCNICLHVFMHLLFFLIDFFSASSCFFAGKEGVTTVAVKTLKENATDIERNDLHSELQVSSTSHTPTITRFRSFSHCSRAGSSVSHNSCLCHFFLFHQTPKPKFTFIFRGNNNGFITFGR